MPRSVDARDSHGRTVLMRAMELQETQVAKALERSEDTNHIEIEIILVQSLNSLKKSITRIISSFCIFLIFLRRSLVF